jgi:hypothetical protein
MLKNVSKIQFDSMKKRRGVLLAAAKDLKERLSHIPGSMG